MSRPKRERPSLPRPYAQLLAESEARRRSVDEAAPDMRPAVEDKAGPERPADG